MLTILLLLIVSTANSVCFAGAAPSEKEKSRIEEVLVNKGKELLNQAQQHTQQYDQSSFEEHFQAAYDSYQKALEMLNRARSIIGKNQGNIQDIEKIIQNTHKDIFLLKLKREPSLYLSSQEAEKVFRENVELFLEEEQPYSALLELAATGMEKGRRSQVDIFTAAFAYEGVGNFTVAAQNYLDLAQMQYEERNFACSLECIRKAELLAKTAKDPFAIPHFLEKLDRDCLVELSENTEQCDVHEWLLKKDAIRMKFEEYLIELNQHSPQKKPPTCFICFNVEEADVGKWLERVLIPDLDKIGIHPLFCFRSLGPGKELNNFQGLIRGADQVIIICTPELKRKCDERKKAPIGVAQEIRLARERYNDWEKYETIFPIYLKGDRKASCPSEFFEPILGSKLTVLDKSTESSVFSYYANAFELFGGMRAVPREFSRKIKELFLSATHKILREEIPLLDVEKWRREQLLKNAYTLKAAQERASKNICVINLPRFPPDFMGRDRELQELNEVCQQSKRVAITGLGGVGKTALTLKYVDQSALEYQFIHFMPAGTPQLIIQGLLQLADDLYLPEMDTNKRLQYLKARLDRIKEPYLLIFDGIDTVAAFEALEKYLPNREGHILLTSRMPEQSRIHGFHVVKLEPLSLKSATNYLLFVTHSKEEKQARDLSEKLGRLPLALAHAAGYMRSRHLPLKKYIEDFTQYTMQLFGEEHLNLAHQEKTVLTTWTISIDAIEKVHHCPLAKEILVFSTFLGESPISLDLLKYWLKTSHPQILELELENALKYLLDYSMINGSYTDCYSVHPLVQKVILYELKRAGGHKVEECLDQALLSLVGYVADVRSIEQMRCAPDRWSALVTWESHACWFLSEFKRDTLSKEVIEIKTLLGNWKLLRGQYTEANEHHRLAFEMSKKLNGEQNIETAFCLHNLGMVCGKQGAFKTAEKLLKVAMDIIIAHSEGLKPQEVMHALNGYAWSLGHMGKYKEAAFYFSKALEIGKLRLKEDSPNVCTSMHGLGWIYALQGYHSKGYEFIKQALTKRKTVCRTCRSNGLIAFPEEELAWILRLQGKYAESIQIFQNAIEKRKAFFGIEHPDDGVFKNEFARTLCLQGQYALSHKYFVEALEILEKSLPQKQHPYIANCLQGLSYLKTAQGAYEEAKQFCEQALAMRKQIFGESHPDVASSIAQLAQISLKEGKCKEAKTLCQEALAMRKDILGESHPDIALSIFLLAQIDLKEGKSEEARKRCEEALAMQRQFLEENHPDVVSSLSLFAGIEGKKPLE